MKSIFLLSLLMVGCAQQNDFSNGTPIFTGVDPQLQSYFDQFTTLTGGISTAGITGGFVSLGGTIAGECIWGGTYNEVRIDSDAWFTYGYDTNMKQQLISHELGHCALHLNHINDCNNEPGVHYSDGVQSPCNQGVNNDYPLSIMNWQMFQSWQASNLANGFSSEYYKYLKLNQPIP